MENFVTSNKNIQIFLNALKDRGKSLMIDPLTNFIKEIQIFFDILG